MTTEKPNSDLSFITNEGDDTLQGRFSELLKDSQAFDCLVAYFYASGFHAVYPYLEGMDKIRVLAGIGLDPQIVRTVQDRDGQSQIDYMSHAQVKQRTRAFTNQDMENTPDTESADEGLRRFSEWLDAGKLKIRVHRDPKIHSKLYIMTFKEGDRDAGRVITGSSNLTRGGLIDNLEFNVELKNRSDYDFAKRQFDQLWKDGVDVTEQYQKAARQHIWIRDELSPYELYLKFLYEYFKEDLDSMNEPLQSAKYLPKGFKDLEYQRQAVVSAKKILLKYGGVFLSDVVGLGKTYMAAMLAKELDGRNLVIAPPALLRSSPGSWERVFAGFNVAARCESLGKLNAILAEGVEMYDNIFIDEAHRFRNDQTSSYSDLMQICRGKKVILITATPYNNKPNDILSLLKIFQLPRQSTIPNVPDLELFFKRQKKVVGKYDRKTDFVKYMAAMWETARSTREHILRHLMVRRTRTEVEKYFTEDMEKGGLKFPQVNAPVKLYYQLDAKENRIFDQTLEHIAKSLTYARYKMLGYHKDKSLLDQLGRQRQENLSVFMKILLLKRLESSFYAFKQSIDRFAHLHKQVIKAYRNGDVYVSKNHSAKLYELIVAGDDAQIEELISAEKAGRYAADDFSSDLLKDLEHDHQILSQIQTWWQDIEDDPKLNKLLKELAEHPTLQENRMIIFTESRETAEYLHREIQQNKKGRPLLFTGSSSDAARDLALSNFDARVPEPADKHNILISTEVLSEGVNLHRASVVINYDLPWNPTRMMQRVGRINRLDTPADQIHTFNFFPTEQAEEHLALEELARGKISAFLNLLGGDAELLTEGEPITSHALFARLGEAKTITGEDEEAESESELKYLQVIRQLAEQDPELLERIEQLPLKARSVKTSDAKTSDIEVLSQAQGQEPLSIMADKQAKIAPALLTYFRKGSLHKFFMAQLRHGPSELDFMSTARLLECAADESRGKLPEWFYNELDKNKDAFRHAISEGEDVPRHSNGGRDNFDRLMDMLKLLTKDTRNLTKEEEEYLQKLRNQLAKRSISKDILTKVHRGIQDLDEDRKNLREVINVCQTFIPDRFLGKHYSEKEMVSGARREIILSLCLLGT